jgi:hypothetical protein
MKELNIQSWNSQKITDLAGKTMFFKCPAQKSHSKFSITNQRDKDLQTLQMLA